MFPRDIFVASLGSPLENILFPECDAESEDAVLRYGVFRCCRRGVLLFVDEADAFLRRRSTEVRAKVRVAYA